MESSVIYVIVVARTPDQYAEQHDPYGQLLFRQFLDYLVILAFHLYADQCRFITFITVYY